MNIAERIGALYRMGNQLTPLLLFGSLMTNFAMFVMLRQEPQVVASRVLAYQKDASGNTIVQLECDTGSGGRQKAAIDVAAKLMKVLFEYQKGNKPEYLARYKESFQWIKTNSPAERVIRGMAEQRARALETGSATFKLDYNLTRAAAKGGLMYVAVVGSWETQTVKGPSEQPIKLDLTFEIGDDNASFILRDISDRK